MCAAVLWLAKSFSVFPFFHSFFFQDCWPIHINVWIVCQTQTSTTASWISEKSFNIQKFLFFHPVLFWEWYFQSDIKLTVYSHNIMMVFCLNRQSKHKIKVFQICPMPNSGYYYNVLLCSGNAGSLFRCSARVMCSNLVLHLGTWTFCYLGGLLPVAILISLMGRKSEGWSVIH